MIAMVLLLGLVAQSPTDQVIASREIHVVVNDVRGTAASGVTVSLLTSIDGKPVQVQVTNAKGEAAFTSLLAGTYDVQIGLAGALTQTIGPMKIGDRCIRYPTLTFVLQGPVSNCY